jgi:hypothetical protein
MKWQQITVREKLPQFPIVQETVAKVEPEVTKKADAPAPPPPPSYSSWGNNRYQAERPSSLSKLLLMLSFIFLIASISAFAFTSGMLDKVVSRTSQSVSKALHGSISSHKPASDSTPVSPTSVENSNEQITAVPIVMTTQAVTPKLTQPRVVNPQTEADVAVLNDEDLKTFLGNITAAPVLLQAALDQVSRRGDASFVPAVATTSEHGHFRIRIEAIKLLAKPPFNSRPEAVQVIIKLLSDKDPLVRGFAAKNLGPWSGIDGLKALGVRANVETDERVLIPMRQSIAQFDAELKK